MKESRREILQKDLRNAVERFREVLAQKPDAFMRDSAIQRFEFTFELAWKTLKEVLREKGVEVYTPRDTFRAAFQAGLIADDPQWLEMVKTRNATSHIYNESMADGVYKSLPTYLPLFEKLTSTLK